jgi:DnaK suppressor protein
MGTRRPNIAAERQDKLRSVLEARRHELTQQLREQMRGVRAAAEDRGGPNAEDLSEEDTQADIDLALMQMASETLRAIDAALLRLEQGKYGNCAACGHPIAQGRLRAMPFAVRCKECEETREETEGRRPALAARREYGPLFDGA